MVQRTCTYPGCGKKHFARGWCSAHYYHWRRYGDAGHQPSTRKSLAERFWAHVQPSEGCWTWEGVRFPQGYGRFRRSRRVAATAHRVAWELTNGPIPDGLQVLHHCDNPPCVKAIADEHGPAHLFLGTQADNIADMMKKGRQRLNPARGERHPRAKLTEVNVLAIRASYATGNTTLERLADQYGVGKMTISMIVRRKSWVWLP